MNSQQTSSLICFPSILGLQNNKIFLSIYVSLSLILFLKNLSTGSASQLSETAIKWTQTLQNCG